MAKVARAHGVKGDLLVKQVGGTEDSLHEGKVLLARPEPGDAARERELTVIESRNQTGSRWLLRFAELEQREAAADLGGWWLGVPGDDLPELSEDEYYNFQVVGMQAVTVDGEPLGDVKEVWETGANDVFVVRGPRGEILVPAIGSVIAELDFDGNRVVISPLPGLLPEEA